MSSRIRRHDLEVLALVRAADVVRLPRPAALEHAVDAAAEVLDEEPVAHLAPVAVDRKRVAVQRVQDHQRNQLLGVLARPVVVRAAADHRLDAVGVCVGRHEQVAGGLGGRVGGGGVERRLLGERSGRDRAVHLVGGDLQVALDARSRAASSRTPVPITCVRAKASWSAMERSTCDSAAKLTTASTPSITSRTAFGSSIAPDHERHGLGKVLPAAGVRELVEHHHLVILRHEPHVGGADEPGRTGHEQLHACTSRSAR